jgi:tetratricopeptide (TPR) repeat protein/SAM-dependent methyltransferase
MASFHQAVDKHMNRKQRRRSGVPGTKPAFDLAAGAAPAGTPDRLFVAAVAQHRSGALADAERQYRYILTLFPGHADSLHNLGLLVLSGGDATAAVGLFEKAIAANGRVAEYHYNLALAWRALERTDRVAAHLERAIDIRSDHALAHLNLGNVRREQGRLSDAAGCYERVLALTPNSAAARFNLANVLAEQSQWDAAIAHYRQSLALEPNHAETHAGLGAALMAQGTTGDAISHFEAAAALRPNLPGVFEQLGRAYMAAGNLELAIHAAARALDLKETAQSRTSFTQYVGLARFTADNNGRFRKLVLRALAESWARPRELAGVCISLIELDEAVKNCIAQADRAWPARLPATELLSSPAVEKLAQDELTCCLLECEPITEIGLERLLTNVRYAMLSAARLDSPLDERMLGFYCSVARQCFVNQYVFSMIEGEAEQAQRLRELLEQALAQASPYSALLAVVVGAYFPLHGLANAEALLGGSWPQGVAALIAQQVEEPATERQIAASIPILTDFDSEVSRAVREQYEESPYPRWVKAGPPIQPSILNERPLEPALDVLIAGCGTGLSTVEFARQVRGARIVAIDLSLASLSYAKRMAKTFGLANIEFGQADIMRLASLGRQFDYVDASGVLHHLADPWAGWRVLLSLLRPGGIMQVGLYSELARQNVVAARALIAERGYRPIPEDIRRCREDIVSSADPLLRSVVQWEDFFTTNECRDLLFHVQEHRISLREIKSFLTANDVQFAGFMLDAPTRHRFAARFPERTAANDLDCWQAFETDAPGTFAGMYQFWVRKPVPGTDETTANPN